MFGRALRNANLSGVFRTGEEDQAQSEGCGLQSRVHPVDDFQCPPQRKLWTCMFYMCGGYEEPDAQNPRRMQQFIENELANIHNIDTSQIGIVVMVDRSPCELYYVDRNQAGQNIQDMAAGYPQERDMADSQTLLDFINYAQTTCPADKYLLEFIGHGRGHLGIVAERDDPPRSDSQPGGYRLLYLDAIADAMRGSGIHFDIIFFNCCTMGTIEVGMSIQHYCDVMIASQDNLDMTYTNNREFLSELVRNPSSPTEELAHRAVEGINREHSGDQNLTISAIRTSRLTNVLQQLNSIQTIFSAGGDRRILVHLIQQARLDTTAFPTPPTRTDPPGTMVDIYDFSRRFKCYIGKNRETCGRLSIPSVDHGLVEGTPLVIGIDVLTDLMISVLGSENDDPVIEPAVLNYAQRSQRPSFGLSVNFPVDNYLFLTAARQHGDIPPFSGILQHAPQWLDLINSLYPFPLEDSYE